MNKYPGWEPTNNLVMVKSGFRFWERIIHGYPEWVIEQEWIREDKGDGYSNSMWLAVPYWEE